MATIRITTTLEEQMIVLTALRPMLGQVVSVSKIADAAKLNKNRVRFILVDLVDTGQIKRVPVRLFNNRYIRYKYELEG